MLLELAMEIIVAIVTVGLLALITLENFEFAPRPGTTAGAAPASKGMLGDASSLAGEVASGERSRSVSIIVPVRGLDPLWTRNVDSFRSLDYPGPIEILYVTDPDDEETTRQLRGYGCKVISAVDSGSRGSGKVLAQSTGLAATTGEVVVFADSDITVDSGWLRELVAPLNRFAAVTTFPWPKPTTASWRNVLRAGFWLSGYDAHASMRGFLWGGSMALTRQTATSAFATYMGGKVFDDLALTQFIKANRGRLAFNGRARCDNVYDETDLLAWWSRQAIVVREFTPLVAWMFLGTSLSILAAGVIGLYLGSPLFLIPFGLWWAKGFLVSLRVARPSVLAPLASLLTLFVTGGVLIGTVFRTRVAWRGRSYQV